MNRRRFLRTTVAAGTAFVALPRISFGREDPPPPSAPKSEIVEVHAPGVIGEGHRPDAARVRRGVEKGILELTGEKDAAAAWRRFVRPDDVVGIKVNAAGGRAMSTHRAVLESVVEGVRSAGIPPERIVLWEQTEEHFTRYYFKSQGIDPEVLGVQVAACTAAIRREHFAEGKRLPGFETEPVKFDWGEVRLAELVANRLTAIINLPVLKDHAAAGVTLSLKNLSHAVVDTPWRCHWNSCDPYIADIVGIPSVRDKLRLHILDGLLGLADGGPSFSSWDPVFTHERLLLSADPVAIDTLGLDWIVGARAKMGFPPLEEASSPIPGANGRPPKHIATAAARGLGTNSRERMEIRRVEVPA